MARIASDGGSSKYYWFPWRPKQVYDIIEMFNMNFSQGNVLKAIIRIAGPGKVGVDALYDWRKIKFAAEREIARLEKENGR